MGSTRSITLQCGREVELMELSQYQMYEGLLLGCPTTQMNEELIERLVRKYSHPERGGGVYVISPLVTPLDVPGSRVPYGTPAALPGMTCVGRFLSDALSDDPRHVWSTLNVIWFQESFAFPVEPSVMSEIHALDWDRYAVGCEP